MTATISGDGTSTLINLTTSGNTVLGDASTDTLNVGNGGLVKDASGNVGIGTSSPAAKLQVLDATAPTIQLSDGSGRNIKLSSGTASTSPSLGTYYASDFLFYTNSVERMRIDSSGNLLLGSTSVVTANERFFIDQPISAYWAQSIKLGNTSNGIIFTNTSGTGSYTAVSFRNNGATLSLCGSITASGTTTTYATSSDYRLKENIAPMTGALAKVAQLNPVTYNWKSTGEDGQGFIAHELQAVVPDAVVGNKDAVDADGNPQYQGIDTSFLVATLTAAIQEQQAIITILTDRITALENK